MARSGLHFTGSVVAGGRPAAEGEGTWEVVKVSYNSVGSVMRTNLRKGWKKEEVEKRGCYAKKITSWPGDDMSILLQHNEPQSCFKLHELHA